MMPQQLGVIFKQQGNCIKINIINQNQDFILRQIQVSLDQIMETQQNCAQNNYIFQEPTNIYQNVYLQELERLIKDIKAYLPHPDGVYYEIITKLLFTLQNHFKIIENIKQDDIFRFVTRLKSIFQIFCECSQITIFCWAMINSLQNYNLQTLNDFIRTIPQEDNILACFIDLCINLSFDDSAATYIMHSALTILYFREFVSVQTINKALNYLSHLQEVKVSFSSEDLQIISQIIIKILTTKNQFFFSKHNKKGLGLLKKLVEQLTDIYDCNQILSQALHNSNKLLEQYFNESNAAIYES